MCLSLEDYHSTLSALNLKPKEGALLKCSGCHAQWWVRLPEKPLIYFQESVILSCPVACGYFGELAQFNPVYEPERPSHFDSFHICRRCGVEYAANGVVLRRPCCAIETPREIMLEFVQLLHSKAEQSASQAVGRDEIESLLERLVRTFDGLMRRMLEIANKNLVLLGSDAPPIYLPQTSSFQNLAGARDRLLPSGWDMEAEVADWPQLTSLFQKRHVLSHRLGVVDQEYVKKTGDASAVVGKKVPLTLAEVVAGAEDCQKLVNGFFGMFLS